MRNRVWKLGRTLTVIIAALTLVTQSALASAGTLDCSFGDWGEVLTAYPSAYAYGASLAIYASGPQQGKIVVGINTNNNVGALRLNANGSTDVGFGTNGFAPTVDYFGSWDYVYGMAALADGKVVIAGQGAGDSCAANSVSLIAGDNHFLIDGADAPTAITLNHLSATATSQSNDWGGYVAFGLLTLLVWGMAAWRHVRRAPVEINHLPIKPQGDDHVR